MRIRTDRYPSNSAIHTLSHQIDSRLVKLHFVVVCGQAICDYTKSQLCNSSGKVVVCGQAICDYTRWRPKVPLRSVVVCGQAICDYTGQTLTLAENSLVVCGQAICDYTSTEIDVLPIEVVVCGQAICDYTIDGILGIKTKLWFAVRLYAITLASVVFLRG